MLPTLEVKILMVSAVEYPLRKLRRAGHPIFSGAPQAAASALMFLAHFRSHVDNAAVYLESSRKRRHHGS